MSCSFQTVLFVHRTLSEAGYRSVLLHGKRSQAERDAAVADFKAGKAQVRAGVLMCRTLLLAGRG